MTFFQLVRREMESSSQTAGLRVGAGRHQHDGDPVGHQRRRASRRHRAASASGQPLLFVIALLLFIQTQHYILITTTAEIEAIIHKHAHPADGLRAALGTPSARSTSAAPEIVGAITRETAILTQASNTLAFAAQGALLIICVTIYVAYLSFFAFVLSRRHRRHRRDLFHAKTRQLSIEQREASKWENKLYERLTDLMDGFKEVRLNSARSEELYQDIVEVSRSAANIKIRTQSETYKRMILLQSSLYTLLGAVAFVVPSFTTTLGDGAITKTITALVFIVAACFGLVQSIPIVAAANAAADRIDHLEIQLRETVGTAEIAPQTLEAVCQDRDRQRRIPLRRPLFGGRLQGRAVQLHAQSRRPRLSHRRQRLRQIDVLQDSGRLLQARLR